MIVNKKYYILIFLSFGSLYAMDADRDHSEINADVLNSLKVLQIAPKSSELNSIVDVPATLSNSTSSSDFQTPMKQKKINDPELTKKRKLEADQSSNKKKIAGIRDILGDASTGTDVNIASPESNKIIKEFNFMKETPGDTKTITAHYIMNRLVTDSVGDNPDSIAKNSQLRNFYQNNPKKNKVITAVAPHLASPLRRNLSVVDIDHILHPIFKYDDAGDLLNVSGGHSPEEYAHKKLFNDSEHVFIGQDNKTIGVGFKDKVQKSMMPGMTKESIIEDLKQGVVVAVDPSSKQLKINQIDNSDRYVGTYQDITNPLVYSTIFPVLTVIKKNKDNLGNVYVGKFSELHEDGSIDNSNDKAISISADNFNKMMESGSKFSSTKENLFVTDITGPLEEYCKEDLKKLGMDHFPSFVYGIQDFRAPTSTSTSTRKDSIAKFMEMQR